MALWIEIRCDVHHVKLWNLTCWNDSGKGPRGLAPHGRTQMTGHIIALERQAVAMGWKRLRGGEFACPNCEKPKLSRPA